MYKRQALVALAFVFAGLYLVDTPKVILVRRVQHRRLALLDLLTAGATAVGAVALAARGGGPGSFNHPALAARGSGEISGGAGEFKKKQKRDHDGQ